MKLFFQTIATVFFALASLGVAGAENGNLNNESELVHEYLWVCTAHNQHDNDHHRLYRGQPQYDRHEAEHSAVNECEYHERHTCELAGCRRLRY